MIWTVGCLYTSPFLRVVYPSIWHRKGAQQDLVQSQSKVWYHHNHVQITKYNPMWGLHMDPKPHAALRRYLPIQVIFVAILSKYHYCPRFHLFHEFRRILDQELHNIFYDFCCYAFKVRSSTSTDLWLTSDKVNSATLDKALDGLVPKNIQVVSNQVHNLLSTALKHHR
jgi:hypothetical protein